MVLGSSHILGQVEVNGIPIFVGRLGPTSGLRDRAGRKHGLEWPRAAWIAGTEVEIHAWVAKAARPPLRIDSFTSKPRRAAARGQRADLPRPRDGILLRSWLPQISNLMPWARASGCRDN